MQQTREGLILIDLKIREDLNGVLRSLTAILKEA
jgi:hypothetical protein